MKTTKQNNKNNRTHYTLQELACFGYSKTDAEKMVFEGRNWIAANGGKRSDMPKTP